MLVYIHSTDGEPSYVHLYAQKNLWENLMSPKCSIVIWKFLHGQISSKTEIQKRGFHRQAVASFAKSWTFEKSKKKI